METSQRIFRPGEHGFTLLETAVSIAVLALLVSMLVTLSSSGGVQLASAQRELAARFSEAKALAGKSSEANSGAALLFSAKDGQTLISLEQGSPSETSGAAVIEPPQSLSPGTLVTLSQGGSSLTTFTLSISATGSAGVLAAPAMGVTGTDDPPTCDVSTGITLILNAGGHSQTAQLSCEDSALTFP
ncbi:MAG TPA: prepilin-type N-terminal cleavage/methylation domain-containing protein [Candidatus Baltobacteraceae bacterium]|jgi:prepilin-type N-terminal cleavage/methylation domain-containing protein|nr:prepilin-type N-terminal cleavage/methylation domain-containing protein [Candidatus Baltobacteraceae bacterium]